MASIAIALAALVAIAPAARAGELRLPGTRAVLDVPAGWTPIDLVAGRGLIAGYRGERGVVAAVTRAPAANGDAYGAQTREAYADQIERGLAARVKGYRRLARRLGEQRGTPSLDLEGRRDDGATIVVRALLFRSYALTVAVEVPPGVDARIARDVAASFVPVKL